MSLNQYRRKISKAAEAVVLSLLVMSDKRRATMFLGDNITVKATRQRKHDGRDKSTTMLLTIGRPNYSERQLVKSFKKNKARLPVGKVLVAAHPRRRAA